MRTRHLLLIGFVAAFAVSLAMVSASAAAAEIPLKGTVNAVETGVTTFPIRSIIRDGGGTATYLGKYTEQVVLQINLVTRSSTGTATFTAANGDTLTTTVVGQATLTTTPGVITVVEVYTITGGTGRFANATGTFTLHSTAIQATGVSSGTFSGVIDSPRP